MTKLGVNIDHIATLRQARRGTEPDPIQAAIIAQRAGAHAIVCHLREDRRHIQDKDVWELKKIVTRKFILEMSLAPQIVAIACRVIPDQAMFVPERRQEITTEGGLNVKKNFSRLDKAFDRLSKKNVQLCVFIDPTRESIKLCHSLGADSVELHTGCYANAKSKQKKINELHKLNDATQYAHSLGLIVNAGHGLKYHDVRAVARIKNIHELNIGHSIISRAAFTGLYQAVKDMIKIIS